MIAEFLGIVCNIILCVAVIVAVIWVTGFIGYLMADICTEGEEETNDHYAVTCAWIVACLAIAALVCSLIFGG